jgi:hypothetical protein
VGAVVAALALFVVGIVLVALCPVLIPVLIICSPLLLIGLLVAGLVSVVS